MLGKSEVSGVPCGRTAGSENGVLLPGDRETALRHVYNATETKENVTSTSHVGTIHSSCLTTCSVDCVTTRPKILRNYNCTRDGATLARKDLSRPAMSARRVSKRATPVGEGSSARDSKLPKNGGKGATRASARSAASYEDSLGRSIVALQKLSRKHDQEIRELAGALTDFWLAHNTLQAVKAGMEAGADYMEEVKKRAGSATHARGGGVRGGTRSRGRGGAQASADVIHGARSGEAGNSDRVLWSVQGERGTLGGRNPSSEVQGEGDDGVRRAWGAQERGRERGTAERRARGKGRATSSRPDAESERDRDGGGRRSENRAGEVSGCIRSELTLPSHGQN